MRRFPDWEERLAAYLEPLREKPFAWGEHDCCTFSAGAVAAMTGEDAMQGFRGYCSEVEARETLTRVGAGTLIRTMNAKFERVHVAHAHRGDIIMVGTGLGIACGAFSIHVGQVGEREGLIRHPRTLWRKAWRVPMPGAGA